MKNTHHKHEKLSESFHHNKVLSSWTLLIVQPKLEFAYNIMLLQCRKKSISMQE
jgi:hypothetical protein